MKLRRISSSIVLTVLILFVLSAFLSVLVYPEIFLTFRVSFTGWSDHCVEYFLSFILINFFYQGNIQLWDYFGQMPMAFDFVTYGFFNFPNMVAAFLYVVLDPFSTDSAQLFQHVFAWGNLMTSLFLRLIGMFLILTCVTKNRWIVLAGSVVAAVFLTPAAFMWGLFRMGFVPLFMFFILRFFQDFELKYLVAVAMLFCVSMVNGVLLSGGYIYFSIHFFTTACLIWSLIYNREGWAKFQRTLKGFRLVPHLRTLLLLAVLALVLIGPYLYMIKFNLSDVAFDAQNSRISRMFSPDYYFHHQDASFIPQGHFFADELNFDRTTHSSVFFGLTLFFLAAAGLLVSRNPIKWVFGIGIILLWLLNHPRDTLNIGLIAHWFNALTNPLRTILRDYAGMSRVVLGYLLAPLAVLGIEEIIRLFSKVEEGRRRWNAAGVVILILAATSLPLLPAPSKVYVIAAAALLAGGIVWIHFKNSRAAKVFLTAAVGCLLAVDAAVIVYFAKSTFRDVTVRPAMLDASPQSGSVGFEFENPKIVPFREFSTTAYTLHDDGYLWFPMGIGSDFRHITNPVLNFTHINGHAPRHIAFESWINDREMRVYVEQNKRTVFTAQQAVKAAPGALGRICAAGLARDVIMVEDPSGKLNLPDHWPSGLAASPEEKPHLKTITGTLSGNPYYHMEGDLVVFKFDLPPDFPKHVASTWFKDDQQYLRFLLQVNENSWMEFSQTQSQLIRPHTFDVQNIREGEMRAAMTKDDLIAHRPYAFSYPAVPSSGVTGVWRSQYDNLGINYRVPAQGWIVFQFPYDPKWKITVDGRVVDYYRVNKSFIGFPIGRGDHKILVQYWPDTPLRFWLLISAILATIGLPVLIYLALRWANPNFQALQ